MVLISSTSIPSPIPMANVVIPTEVAYKINKSVTPSKVAFLYSFWNKAKQKQPKTLIQTQKFNIFSCLTVLQIHCYSKCLTQQYKNQTITEISVGQKSA